MPSIFDRELTLLGPAEADGWRIRLDVFERMQNLIILAQNRRICFVNGAGRNWLGYTMDVELIGGEIDEIFHHDYIELISMGLDLLVDEKMIPVKLIRKDGVEIDVEMWVNRLGTAGGDIFIVEARDITAHLRAARALRSREQWLEDIINTVADGIITIDHRGMVQSFNPAAERIFRFKSGEIIGKSIRQLIPTPATDEEDADSDTEWQRLMLPRDEVLGQRKDGAVFPMEISVREMLRGGSVAYAGVVRDITARRRAEEQIRHLAHHDQLTGLPNRFLFSDRLDEALQRAIRRKNKVALVFVDLDDFKPINDAHGHAVGDKVLALLASRMRTALRKTDTVARVGGDEFVTILEDISGEDQVRQLACKIMAAVTAGETIDGVTHQVSASLGVAIFPEDAKDSVALIELADKAMYRAKAKGSRHICLHPETLWEEPS